MIEINPYPIPTAETVRSWPGYLYFVHERESIRIKREQGKEGPWTLDPILARYRFCNIRRQDDRVSQWVIKNIIEPFGTLPDLWFNLVLTRLINWPPTLQYLIDCKIMPCTAETFDGDAFIKALEILKSTGVKVYGGAYMVYPTRKDPGTPKSVSLVKYIIGDIIKQAPEVRRSLAHNLVEDFTVALSQCFGMSTFMSGQVAADLTYGGAEQLGWADDLYTFAPLGPGSQIGLNYLLLQPLPYKWKPLAFNEALQEAGGYLVDELHLIGDKQELTLHDIQNTLCEYGKYCRSVLGTGKPKSLYKPEGAF